MEPNRTPITAACPLREQWRPELGIVYCARVGSDYELYLWEEKERDICVHTQCSHQALQQQQATNMPIIRVSCQTASPETSHPRTVKNTFHGYLTKKHMHHVTRQDLGYKDGTYLRTQQQHILPPPGKTFILKQVQEEGTKSEGKRKQGQMHDHTSTAIGFEVFTPRRPAFLLDRCEDLSWNVSGTKRRQLKSVHCVYLTPLANRPHTEKGLGASIKQEATNSSWIKGLDKGPGTKKSWRPSIGGASKLPPSLCTNKTFNHLISKWDRPARKRYLEHNTHSGYVCDKF